MATRITDLLFHLANIDVQLDLPERMHTNQRTIISTGSVDGKFQFAELMDWDAGGLRSSANETSASGTQSESHHLWQGHGRCGESDSIVGYQPNGWEQWHSEPLLAGALND